MVEGKIWLSLFLFICLFVWLLVYFVLDVATNCCGAEYSQSKKSERIQIWWNRQFRRNENRYFYEVNIWMFVEKNISGHFLRLNFKEALPLYLTTKNKQVSRLCWADVYLISCRNIRYCICVYQLILIHTNTENVYKIFLSLLRCCWNTSHHGTNCVCLKLKSLCAQCHNKADIPLFFMK